MGYTIAIGNAVPKFRKEDFPELFAQWEVEYIKLAEAPTFPNDECTGRGNHRSPTYSVWRNFCKITGLYPLFYETNYYHNGLMAEHRGCVGIMQRDAHLVTQAYGGCNGR